MIPIYTTKIVKMKLSRICNDVEQLKVSLYCWEKDFVQPLWKTEKYEQGWVYAILWPSKPTPKYISNWKVVYSPKNMGKSHNSSIYNSPKLEMFNPKTPIHSIDDDKWITYSMNGSHNVEHYKLEYTTAWSHLHKVKKKGDAVVLQVRIIILAASSYYKGC